MPNSQVLEQKKQTVAALTEKMKAAHSAVFVDYKGINVADDTALRKALLKEGVQYSVVKNTLARFAAKEAGYEQLGDIFNGTTAMASSEDYTAAARVLCDFAKSHENFTIKAGFVDSDILDANGVKALAEIPSKEALIAKMLGSLQSSLYGLAYVLQAKIDKDSAAAEA